MKEVDVGKRKHWSQISKLEDNHIRNRLKSVQEDEWRINRHTFDRLLQKGIRATRKDIISTIYNANLIEYRIEEVTIRGVKIIDERVVLRSKSIVNECYNLHVVYSITTKTVVTVWMNHIKDLHKTLDMSIYSADMRVIGL